MNDIGIVWVDTLNVSISSLSISTTSPGCVANSTASTIIICDGFSSLIVLVWFSGADSEFNKYTLSLSLSALDSFSYNTSTSSGPAPSSPLSGFPMANIKSLS